MKEETLVRLNEHDRAAIAELYLNAEIDARCINTADFQARWLGTLDGECVTMHDNFEGFKTREEAIEDATNFREYCSKIFNSFNRKANRDE